jgi:lipoprotein-releasing system permease protein
VKNRASLFIALRYLLGRGREGGRYLRGAALGIALSLVPIVVTLVVADGMIRGITERYLELGTGHLEVYGRNGRGEIAVEAPVVSAVAGVRGAWPERQGLGILVGRGGKSGATVRSLAPGFLSDEGTRRYLKTIAGVATIENTTDAILGEELARRIGAGVGDTVRLMTARTTADGRTVPRLAPFKVRGIVSSGYRELDALWFIIHYEAGLRVLSPEASRSFLAVKIDDPYGGADAAASAVAAALGRDFSVYTWGELQRSQYRSLESTRQLLLFIMALVVIVAAVNVAAATSMLVVERRRDIAVLKGFGADSGGTTRIFVYGALLAGAIGSVLGISAGLAIAYNINGIIRAAEAAIAFFSLRQGGASVKLLDPAYYLESIPTVVDWPSIVAIASLTIVLSAMAAWAPARRAGKLVPNVILRKY